MNYFILFYRIVLEDGQAFGGRAMTATRGSVLLESEIVSSIEAGFRRNRPGHKKIQVSVLKVRETTFKAYNDFNLANDSTDISGGFLMGSVTGKAIGW